MDVDVMKQIDEAVSKKDLDEVMRLTKLPLDVITGQRIMTRKERREWYHQNRKRLKLSTWGSLGLLSKK